MKKSLRRFLYNILVVFMAVLMASMTAVQVFAAGRNKDKKTERDIANGKVYVKDVIIVTESEKINLSTIAAYQDYVVLSEPIKTFAADSGHESLYFAVKTTEDPNEAITDIKAMNMNGDYSYDAYREYLSEVEKWATKKADTTMIALDAFRENYNDGSPSATFAYNMMNYLVGDNEDVALGDFFVIDDYASSYSIQVKNIVMKANINTLTYFRQLLLVACAETADEKNFVDKLLTHTKGNDLIPNPDYDQYKTAAEDLMYSMGKTGNAIKAYRDALTEKGDGLEDYLEKESKELELILKGEKEATSDEILDAKEKNDKLKEIYTGLIISKLFENVYYTDNDGNQMSLPDILVKDPDAENEADCLTADMLLPIVALMNDGQRALCGCGFDELVASVINDYNENSEYKESLEEIREFWATISEEELISVYAGVDLSLYDPNGIAMVGKSGEFLNKAEKAKTAFGVSDLAAGIMAGGAVIGIAGSCALVKAGKYYSNLGVSVEETGNIDLKTFQNYSKNQEINIAKYGSETYANGSKDAATYFRVDEETLNSEIARGQNLQIGGSVLKAFGYFMIVLSVALLIFSIVTFIMNAIEKAKPAEYLQVPRVLVNAIEKEEYDERQQKTTSTQMIFYKGIIDPFMSDEKAKANVSPSKVQDLLDWSLTTRDREWIAVYTTKDGRVGNPIIFDGTGNTFLTLVEGNGKTYSALESEKQFNGRVNIFNKDSYTVCGNGVIIFNRDLDATSTTKTGLGASMNISNGYFILFILVAVMAGAGVGAGVTYLVNKSRKKKLAVSQ